MNNEFSEDVNLLHFATTAFRKIRLCCLDPSYLNEINLTEELKLFLQEVGVPAEETLGWDFDPNKYGLQKIADVASSFNASGFENDDRRVIAGGQDILACIDTHTDGKVIALDLLTKEQTEFINSSLMEFLVCLAAFFEATADATNQQPVGDCGNIVSRLKRNITQIDPKCIRSPDSWWSIIIQEMEYGLL